MKSKKGITLVALVVTIVILLILAGIAISGLTGENGLINRAKDTREEAIRSSAIEEIRLIINEVQTDKTIIGEQATLEDLCEKLNAKTDIYEVDAFSTESASVTRVVGDSLDLKTEVKYILIRNKTKYGVEVKVTDTFEVSATGVTTSLGGEEPPEDPPQEPTVYSITYNYGGGTATNPATYTEETDSFTLVNPTRNGYLFIGWTGTGLASSTMQVIIAKGSTGDRSYTANWQQHDTSYAPTVTVVGNMPNSVTLQKVESNQSCNGLSGGLAESNNSTDFAMITWFKEGISEKYYSREGRCNASTGTLDTGFFGTSQGKGWECNSKNSASSKSYYYIVLNSGEVVEYSFEVTSSSTYTITWY